MHRLVRISPTDAKKRRQTTFAGVEVLPVLPDDIEVEVAPGEISRGRVPRERARAARASTRPTLPCA